MRGSANVDRGRRRQSGSALGRPLTESRKPRVALLHAEKKGGGWKYYLLYKGGRGRGREIGVKKSESTREPCSALVIVVR